MATFEKIEEFYPGLCCYFTEDYHSYYAGNILIVSREVKTGGIHKVIFDDGYIMPSKTAAEILAVQHLPFIQQRLENIQDRLSFHHRTLADVEGKPQQLKEIFGEFARDIRPNESQVKGLNDEIKRLEEYSDFIRRFERAIFSFVAKYVKETPTNNKECTWFGRQGVFDMTVSMLSAKVNNRKMFDFYDYRHPTKICVSDDSTVECIQKAFEAELNAVGIECSLEDEFGL